MRETRDWYDRVPKVELHVHLEGAIPLDALWTLVQKYGGSPDAPTPEALVERFRYRDFAHFIDTWVWKNRFLRELDDFTFIAEAVARDLARRNIVYVEAFYSPPDFHRIGITTQAMTEAMRRGLARVPEIQIALVADLVRDFGPDRAARTLEEVAEVREHGVIGIGIGGSEQHHPPEPFAAVYERARELGFRTSAHAGEAAGAESVRGAIEALRVDRVGHGTRAGEDAAVVELLRERRVPLEMCPGSNVCTGVVDSVAAHPVRRYMDTGLLITINTDDPAMFGNSLAGEFRELAASAGFTRDDVRRVLLNAVEASWLSPPRKSALAARLSSDPVWRDDS